MCSQVVDFLQTVSILTSQGIHIFICQTNVDGMPEDKIRVSARIPKSLYDTCLHRYDNITTAINTGLELLCLQDEDETKTKEDKRQTKEDTRRQNEDMCQTDEDGNSKGDIKELKARLEEKDKQIKDLESASREKYAEILRLQNIIQEAPDPVELAEMKGLYEGKMQVIEEKNKRIEALEREISRLDMFAHYFKNVEIKQIEAPEEKKKWWRFW